MMSRIVQFTSAIESISISTTCQQKKHTIVKWKYTRWIGASDDDIGHRRWHCACQRQTARRYIKTKSQTRQQNNKKLKQALISILHPIGLRSSLAIDYFDKKRILVFSKQKWWKGKTQLDWSRCMQHIRFVVATCQLKDISTNCLFDDLDLSKQNLTSKLIGTAFANNKRLILVYVFLRKKEDILNWKHRILGSQHRRQAIQESQSNLQSFIAKTFNEKQKTKKQVVFTFANTEMKLIDDDKEQSWRLIEYQIDSNEQRLMWRMFFFFLLGHREHRSSFDWKNDLLKNKNFKNNVSILTMS